VLGNAVSVADSGALAVSGGAQEAAALEASVASGMAVGACHTAVVGGGTVASAEATVANVSFTSGASFFGTTTITAEFVMSRAEAICAATGVSISGVVQVTGLVINGQVVTVTGAANQFVFLSDGGYVIINEQTAGFGSITVNAVHVYLNAGALASGDIIISQSHCDVAGGNVVPVGTIGVLGLTGLAGIGFAMVQHRSWKRRMAAAAKAQSLA